MGLKVNRIENETAGLKSKMRSKLKGLCQLESMRSEVM